MEGGWEFFYSLRGLAGRVANEILDIQEWLAKCRLPRARLMAGMVEGFDGDPDHICTGRSAPERLIYDRGIHG